MKTGLAQPAFKNKIMRVLNIIAILSFASLFLTWNIASQSQLTEAREQSNHDSQPYWAGSRSLQFSGYLWRIKASGQPLGPGPNYFSQSSESVRLDEKGRLHLTIRKQGRRWLTSEVVCVDEDTQFGYGWYIFKLASPWHEFDKNTVVGLFTWDETQPPHYQEIDIEFSRWGNEQNENSQYAVQPISNSMDILHNRLHRFEIQFSNQEKKAGPHNYETTHVIFYQPHRILFLSYYGFPDDKEIISLSKKMAAGKDIKRDEKETSDTEYQLITSWDYISYTEKHLSDIHAIPVPTKNSEVRINFWLYRGMAPTNNKDHELIIESFSFYPLY